MAGRRDWKVSTGFHFPWLLDGLSGEGGSGRWSPVARHRSIGVGGGRWTVDGGRWAVGGELPVNQLPAIRQEAWTLPSA